MVSAPWSLGKKLGVSVATLLVAVVVGGYWWWTHRPVPPYQVEDAGLYPFIVPGADGSHFGMVNIAGGIVAEPVWDGISTWTVLGRAISCNEGLCGVAKGGKWGYLDYSGKLAVPTQFDYVAPFFEGMAHVKLGSLHGYIDKTGHYVINPQFNDAGDFHMGLAPAEKDGYWGFIDTKGHWAMTPQFSSVDLQGFINGLAGVCAKGGEKNCGYISRSGNFEVAPQFDGTGTFSGNLAPVKVGQQWAYVDRSGTIVINPQFDEATPFLNHFALVVVSGKPATINEQGNYVINPGQYAMGYSLVDYQFLPGGPPDTFGFLRLDGSWQMAPTKTRIGYAPGSIYERAFLGEISGQFVPVAFSGKVLAGWYKGALLGSLGQDLADEANAITSMRSLVAAEAAYSNSFPAIGFAGTLLALGPSSTGSDENHAGLIDASLASGTENNYQFNLAIPAGTSSGGSNFNYQLIAKPLTGHAGRTFCADSTGTIRYAAQDESCTTLSPILPPT